MSGGTGEGHRTRARVGVVRTLGGFPGLLYLFVPLALVADLLGAGDVTVFILTALAIVPGAKLMSDATEHLAAHSGPAVAGLINVSLGNAPELIIATFAVAAGLHELVKATLVGSIIANELLVLGGAMLVGGRKRARQTFSSTAVQSQTGLVLVVVAALTLPAVAQLVKGGELPGVDATRVVFDPAMERLSVAVAVILVATYAAGLVFSLRTHRSLLAPHAGEEPSGGAWSIRRALIAVTIGAALVSLLSHLLVGSIAGAAHSLGLSEFFIGVFIVAIVGNAAEHYGSLAAAARDDMDLAVSIALGSSIQIGLFVVPVLVVLSFAVGPSPMPMVLNGFELAGVVLAALITALLTSDGESTWLEGVELLAVYALLGVAFFFA